jgi:lipopolysaccharide biosynthesis glycosyltransferase
VIVALQLHALTLADEHFALPLAVMGRSILDHLRPGARVRLTVIDGGLAPATRQRVLDSWDERITVAWREPGLGELSSLLGQRIPPLTLARLRVASLLPGDCCRGLVLDADQLVCTDLARLHDEVFGGAAVLAPRDAFIPTVSSPNGLALAARLGLAPDTPFLCGALLVIDLRAWRAEGIEDRAIGFVRRHADLLRTFDQDALNAVLAGRWRVLDPRWQVQPRALELSPRVTPHLNHQVRALLRRDPWVVHFSGRLKPWLYRGRSPFDAAFRATLARTAFAGEPPPSRWRDWAYRVYDGPLRRLAYPLERRADAWLRGAACQRYRRLPLSRARYGTPAGETPVSPAEKPTS